MFVHKRMSLADESCSRAFRLYLVNCLFIYACVILFSSRCDSLKTDNFTCELKDSCQCMFQNEEGFDLSQLSENNYGLNATSNNLTFYFHPCTDISIGNASVLNACHAGVSVCMFNRTNEVYTQLGSSHEMSVISRGIRDIVVFVYKHNNSVTNIQLICAPGANYLEVLPSKVVNVYELKLTSFAACKRQVFVRQDPSPEPSGHLSTGSVLVIMFVVFVSLYFVGGALTLKLLRGAEGTEMIPNYDFWVSLPGLVKEGFLFVVNGCRPMQAYDRI